MKIPQIPLLLHRRRCYFVNVGTKIRNADFCTHREVQVVFMLLYEYREYFKIISLPVYMVEINVTLMRNIVKLIIPISVLLASVIQLHHTCDIDFCRFARVS